MRGDFWIIFDWLKTHEQSLAIWLEGLALVAIFCLELKEYKRQGRERKEQRKESETQMALMQRQADATMEAAAAAKTSADALVNSERAWVGVETAELILTVKQKWEARLKIRNMGRTIARIKRVSVGTQASTKALPDTPPEHTGTKLCDYILCPNCEFPMHEMAAVGMTNYELQDCRTGLVDWYIYGTVEYLDIGEVERITSFVLLYHGKGQSDRFLPFLDGPQAYYKTT